MLHSPRINKAYVFLALNLDFAPVDQVFKGSGVTAESMEQGDSIELKTVIKLIRNLKRYSHTPMWPTMLGEYLGINSHGPVGYAAISAPTVGKALSTFIEWGQVRFDTYTGSIIERDETFELIVGDTTGSPELKEVFFESFMRAFEVLTTLILGKQPKGSTALYFERSASSSIQLLMIDAYDSTLFFEADCNKLTIPKHIWFARSPLYDKDSFEFNLRKCQQLLNERNLDNRPDLAVRSVINKYFERGINENLQVAPPPNLSKISQLLNLSDRTLNRKLKYYSTSYKLILEKERSMISARLLSEARYSVADVSDLLGYRESANFCRAFKSWYGLSPTSYRRQLNKIKTSS
ncbi:MAG: AraC-like DNA-binding protein [Pseudohongiellaceae bacterium]|jgi:AraC-like DNA-binding protein